MSTEITQDNGAKAAAWSLYWAQDRLHSCVAADNDVDQKAVDSIWQDFSAQLEKHARVLDLATGNGAVAVAMLSKNPGLSIDAIDQADIDPHQFLSGLELLKAARFHGNTDILNLPFEANTFDAITSQYGIEYAGLAEATVKVIPLLKKSGQLSFLIHHTGSAIILSSGDKIKEMQELLKPSGVIDTLMLVLRGELEFHQLEILGQEYLEADTIKTQQISGQVFAGIEKIAKTMGSVMSDALNMGATIRLRLESELARLQQMAASAHNEQSISEFCDLLESQGLQIETNRAVYANSDNNEYLLGYLVSGRKII